MFTNKIPTPLNEFKGVDIANQQMDGLPCEVVGHIMGYQDDRDRQALLLSNPPRFMDAVKTCTRVKVHLHDRHCVDDAAAHCSVGTERLHIVSESMFYICMLLRKIEPLDLKTLTLTIKNYTPLDGLYCVDQFCDIEGTVSDTIRIHVDTIDDDDISTFVLKACKLMEGPRHVTIDYPVGTISLFQVRMTNAVSVDLLAAKIAKSVWGTECPSLRQLRIVGTLIRFRQSVGLQSEALLEGATLDDVSLEVDAQLGCDFVLHLLRNCAKVYHLKLMYKMPVCITRGVPSVERLTLHSVYNMSIDVLYPTLCEEWVALKQIVVTKGMSHPCLFGLRFLETSHRHIKDILMELAQRWTIDIPLCVSLEIDRM